MTAPQPGAESPGRHDHRVATAGALCVTARPAGPGRGRQNVGWLS
ncbi:hypothetical protein BCL65_10431 [Isoptericola halotolerans]|uniref:Uncharacterized protein n=1 Tax=Isoptericola halotolerans TaxID=300560 RepID=A0ABX5EEL9_9MICO|nr:hypothetical protein BCL65_10431 [Isoptericola halotolerans]